MSRSIWADANDVITMTIVNGNVDPNKIIPYVERAQDKIMLDFLGQPLYERLEDLVVNAATNTSPHLNEPEYAYYKGLFTQEKVIPTDDTIEVSLVEVVAHWAVYYFIKYGEFELGDKGIYKEGSRNSTLLTNIEKRQLLKDIKSDVEDLMLILDDYLCDNSEHFPEYNSTDGYQRPSSYQPIRTPFGGIS